MDAVAVLVAVAYAVAVLAEVAYDVAVLAEVAYAVAAYAVEVAYAVVGVEQLEFGM